MRKRKSKDSQKPRTPNNTLRHQLKLHYMKDCVFYGKSIRETQEYFKSKGESLSISNYTMLKKQVFSVENQKHWFSREALFVMEEDHRNSVERIRNLENHLVMRIHKIMEKKDPDIEELHLFIRLMAEFRATQETKSKLFSATPQVQELMTIHRQQLEETNIVNSPFAPEKDIIA